MYRTNFLSKDCSYNEDTCLLIDYKYTIHLEPSVIIHDLYSLSSENFDNIVKLDWPKPFREDGDAYDFEILGSANINSILCLRTIHGVDWTLIFWNPTTNEFKVIPTSPAEYERIMYEDVHYCYHLVGYDCIKDDYKVIRFIEYDEYNDDKDDDYDDEDDDYDASLVSYREIYSLNNNLWRGMDIDVPLFSNNKDVYMDGVSHW
jgi:molecular chaperone HtpG